MESAAGRAEAASRWVPFAEQIVDGRTGPQHCARELVRVDLGSRQGTSARCRQRRIDRRPQGNPTNLVLITRAGLTRETFLATMLVPGLAATVVCGAGVAILERGALRAPLSRATVGRTRFSPLRLALDAAVAEGLLDDALRERPQRPRLRVPMASRLVVGWRRRCGRGSPPVAVASRCASSM